MPRIPGFVCSLTPEVGFEHELLGVWRDRQSRQPPLDQVKGKQLLGGTALGTGTAQQIQVGAPGRGTASGGSFRSGDVERTAYRSGHIKHRGQAHQLRWCRVPSAQVPLQRRER